MTSNAKRKFAEIASHDEPEGNFLYNPSGPLYSFSFIDQLVTQYCPRTAEKETVPKLELECCPRAYENDFLREPVGNEQHCANDNECEGMKINCQDPFILREFYLPSENNADQTKPSARKLCLMCTRLVIAKQYFHYESQCQNVPDSVYCSKFFNVCETPGEYSIKDCIVNGQNGHSGLVLPVVLHTRSAYEFEIIDGVKTYTQKHYSDNTEENNHDSAFLRKGAILTGRESIARSD